MPGRIKRRNYWSYPTFQKSFIRQVTVCSFFGALFVAAITFLAMIDVLGKEFSDHRFERQIKTFAAVKWVGESGAFDRDLLRNPEIIERYQKRIHSRALAAALQAFAIAMLVLLPGLAAAGMFMSHRMVGGIVRIEAHLRRILNGQTHETLVCRQGDELQPLVETLSALDRAYLLRMKQIKESSEKIRENLRMLKKDPAAEGKLKLVLQEQENALVQIEKILTSGGI